MLQNINFYSLPGKFPNRFIEESSIKHLIPQWKLNNSFIIKENIN